MLVWEVETGTRQSVRGKSFIGIYEKGVAFGPSSALSDVECDEEPSAETGTTEDEATRCNDLCRTMKGFSVLGCMANISALLMSYFLYTVAAGDSDDGPLPIGCLICLKGFAG